jgi:hypothetical protein
MVAEDPLPAILLIPDTTARVQAKVAVPTALVAVYVFEILVHQLAVRRLVIVGVGLTEMTTSSEEAVHGELLIVQRNVAEVPLTNPVTPEVRDAGVVIVAAPLIRDQAPVPVVGAFAARVVVATLQSAWSGPALAVVGGAMTVIVIPVLVAGEPVAQAMLEAILHVITSACANVLVT